MSERLAVQCWNPQQAHAAITGQVWPQLKSMLMAGHRMVVKVEREKRSLRANARLHAMLTEIAQQVQWAGKPRDVECWKRLLTAAWLRARGEPLEMLPAIDGHGVDIVFRRTSDLTGPEISELMSFIEAWAAEAGVSFPAMEEGV
jgi:hypothetical protein